MESANLTNQFLIAMPGLDDPNFSQTVTFICAHNDEGAMGIVINRPTNLMLSEVLLQMDIDAFDEDVSAVNVVEGGPVQQDRGFVIHEPTGDWDSMLQVGDDIAVTTSRDVLNALATGSGPKNTLIALGYAGWGAGQLEAELKDNAWLSGPVNPAILFDTPFEDRWHRSAQLMGVDLHLMSGNAGHA